MKVLKSTPQQPRKSEFGDFELQAALGWKIARSFIDFESKLLIVSENDTDEANWINTGYGTRRIPSKEYVINPKNGHILTQAEWASYFDYEPQEIMSEDGRLKLVIQRVYEPERGSDGIIEKLVEIETGATIASSSGIAFHDQKRENLLEQRAREKKEQEQRQREIDAMPDLQKIYKQAMTQLSHEDVILQFEHIQSQQKYRLVYTPQGFEFQIMMSNPGNQHFVTTHTYLTLDEFANFLFANNRWFMNYHPWGNDKKAEVFSKYMIGYANYFRATHDFTFEEHEQLDEWVSVGYPTNLKPGTEKQFCSNCKKEVMPFGRYPLYICEECSNKTITDENGVELSFANEGFSGGFVISYLKNGQVIKQDNSKNEKICYIEGKKFIACEARFGGIVIQKYDETIQLY